MQLFYDSPSDADYIRSKGADTVPSEVQENVLGVLCHLKKDSLPLHVFSKEYKVCL